MISRTPISTPDLDTIFGLLSDRRRRYTLYALYRVGGNAMTIDRLATRVNELEANAGIDDGRPEGIERTTEELRRHHLPKLDDAGIVEYDRRSDTVRYHAQPSLEEWLEHAEYKEGFHPEC